MDIYACNGCNVLNLFLSIYLKILNSLQIDYYFSGLSGKICSLKTGTKLIKVLAAVLLNRTWMKRSPFLHSRAPTMKQVLQSKRKNPIQLVLEKTEQFLTLSGFVFLKHFQQQPPSKTTSSLNGLKLSVFSETSTGTFSFFWSTAIQNLFGRDIGHSRKFPYSDFSLAMWTGIY